MPLTSLGTYFIEVFNKLTSIFAAHPNATLVPLPTAGSIVDPEPFLDSWGPAQETCGYNILKNQEADKVVMSAEKSIAKALTEFLATEISRVVVAIVPLFRLSLMFNNFSLEVESNVGIFHKENFLSVKSFWFFVLLANDMTKSRPILTYFTLWAKNLDMLQFPCLELSIFNKFLNFCDWILSFH